MPIHLRSGHLTREDDAMPRMIPDEESAFVGRVEVLGLIRAAMSTNRMVTLTGTGGAGRTRLARQSVSAESPGSGHDVAWADLSPLHNADLLAVADAFDLSDHTPRMPTDAISAWVRDREVLLVLDCCEHLSAECRDLRSFDGERRLARLRTTAVLVVSRRSRPGGRAFGSGRRAVVSSPCRAAVRGTRRPHGGSAPGSTPG